MALSQHQSAVITLDELVHSKDVQGDLRFSANIYSKTRAIISLSHSPEPTMAKLRSCLMIKYDYTCLNMICLSMIMIANHVLVTCLTIKHDQDANEFYQCKNVICSLDYDCSF